MAKIQNKPWTTGPKELMDHADAHIKNNSAFDHRIAFISIDNAVELMIRTFLSIPKRARGKEGPSRKKIESAVVFSDLIDLLEEYADDLIKGIELADIEWYHRIRNNLYHQGNGITIDKEQLISYREIARILYQNLFDIKLTSIPEGPTGIFLENWGELENRLRTAALPYIRKPHHRPSEHLVQILLENNIVDETFVKNFEYMRKVRNSLAHGYGLSGLDAGYILGELSKLINSLPDWKNKQNG